MYKKMLEQRKQPLLIVISGPSGVGKDSVIERMKERGLPFHFVVTTTSRTQRSDEVEGMDYFFVTKEAFEGMIERDEFFEYATVYHDYKGIPKKRIREALAGGQDVVMRLDVQGAETVRYRSPEAVLVFLSTSDEEELRQRLQRRQTDTPESLRIRIETARHEFGKIDLFDYYVVNAEGKLDEAVDTILAIIKAEHHRTHSRKVTL
ncbi:MAG: guanylate kinase [Chloroflexi bacterium RBG_16_48_8]|nr:MAG: guanylate kinase [Chloroflexi bacterium RBG_16_48_8]